MRAHCRKKLYWFLQDSSHGETKHLHRPLAVWSGRFGPDETAVTEHEGWMQCTFRAPELLSPRLSDELPQPKCLLGGFETVWMQDAGVIMEGGYCLSI